MSTLMTQILDVQPKTPKTSKKITKKNVSSNNVTENSAQIALLREAASLPSSTLLDQLQTSPTGLTRDEAEERLEEYGRNEVHHDRPEPAIIQFLKTFLNPFIMILIFLGVVMFITDVLLADPAEGSDFTGVITVSIMVTVSVVLRFWQEYQAGLSAQKLKNLVRTTTAVTRNYDGKAETKEIPIEYVVPGDIIEVAAGDMIPADVRFIRIKDLQINQSMLTGESVPVEKEIKTVKDNPLTDIFAAPNIGFMGTSVVSGSGTAIAIGTGKRSYFGSMSTSILTARPETSFDKGIKKVTFLLIKFMLVMVPTVFIINGLTKNWLDAFLFGVTTAVGLTPEMLPLVVTANLAKGAKLMSRHKVIVKKLNSIQNLGAMDVLCTDKTGTLTEDRIVLERHVDVLGKTSAQTLRYGATNSHFQTGLRNLLDSAVLKAAGDKEIDSITTQYKFVDEMPFDFQRRRMSVVVDDGYSHIIITKGAVEEVLAQSTSELRDGNLLPITAERRTQINALVNDHNQLGMRVLAVAIRKIQLSADQMAEKNLHTEYQVSDEKELTLVGFLSFLDPPKASAKNAIESLAKHGVAVKVITGDNLLVATTVCQEIGLDVTRYALGEDIEHLSIVELAELAENTTIFAKINPLQKARIVEALRSNGHTVGFLGDGINDAPALRAADVGISVDTAVDIAKESANFILLEKDLMVLEEGVVEGRKTFINTMKYLKLTVSSNFGNMFSVLVASAWLPFLPMIPVVVLVQNLTYDLSMLTMPWDRVDEEDIAQPRKWEPKSLFDWMVRIGPISSIFDISTYALMWFFFHANNVNMAALFQSGWFCESILSQIIIVQVLRTRKIPFIQSRSSWMLIIATLTVCIFGIGLPFSSWGQALGLVSLPWSYFPWLVATLVAYWICAQIAKNKFIVKFNDWI